MPREPEIVEPALVLDVFATGVFPPEEIGNNVRIVAYADVTMPGTRRMVRQIVAKLVMPRAAGLEAYRQITEALALPPPNQTPPRMN